MPQWKREQAIQYDKIIGESWKNTTICEEYAMRLLYFK